MKGLHTVTFILLVVGGLNWGLEGLFDWGVGSFLPEGVATLVYILVGLAAVVEIFTHKKNCRCCDVKAPSQGSMPQM